MVMSGARLVGILFEGDYARNPVEHGGFPTC